MNAPRHWRTLTLRGNYCSALCHHSSLRCNCRSKLQWIKELRLLIDVFLCAHKAHSDISRIALLNAFLPHSVSLLARLVNTDAIMHSIIRRIGDECLLWPPLHLNNRSTAVFKKLITFLAVAKVSRNAAPCNIGGSDRRQISAGTW